MATEWTCQYCSDDLIALDKDAIEPHAKAHMLEHIQDESSDPEELKEILAINWEDGLEET